MSSEEATRYAKLWLDRLNDGVVYRGEMKVTYLGAGSEVLLDVVFDERAAA